MVTMRNIKEMANSICEELKVTVDEEDNHEEKMIPMLDVQVWRTNDKMRIKHMFYEKPIASQKVMGERTAIPMKNKITILGQEVYRRLRNTGRNVETKIRIQIVDKFVEKLRRSGYRERERGEIVKAGVRCYYRRLKSEKGGKKVNGGREKRSVRKIKKIVNKNKWYSKNEEKRTESEEERKRQRASNNKGREEEELKVERTMKTETVIFIPYTPGSVLKREIQKWENKFCKTMKVDRVKFEEVGGRKVKQMVMRNNPWGDIECGRKECVMCEKEESRGKCRKEGVIYEIKCEECGKSYIGQSSRSCYERYKEHYDGEQNENDENMMWKHDVNDHEGSKQKYGMKIIRRERLPIRRQIGEKMEIEKNNRKGRMMNSRSEWGGSPLP